MYLILKKSVSKKKPQIWPKMAISYFKPILSAILVTIATRESEINAKILLLGYSSNKPMS